MNVASLNHAKSCEGLPMQRDSFFLFVTALETATESDRVQVPKMQPTYIAKHTH
jgi:hypothetical protein